MILEEKVKKEMANSQEKITQGMSRFLLETKEKYKMSDDELKKKVEAIFTVEKDSNQNPEQNNPWKVAPENLNPIKSGDSNLGTVTEKEDGRENV